MKFIFSCLLALLFLQSIEATRLIDAVKGYDTQETKQYIREGDDVNAKDKDGNTPLHWAAIRDNVEIIDVLVANGAKIAPTNFGNYTPLDLAVRVDSAKTVKRFLPSSNIKKRAIFLSFVQKTAKAFNCVGVLQLFNMFQ